MVDRAAKESAIMTALTALLGRGSASDRIILAPRATFDAGNVGAPGGALPGAPPGAPPGGAPPGGETAGAE